MTQTSIGIGAMVIGIALLDVRVIIQGQMQRVVAKLAPPKTNRPLKNLFEALNRQCVRREYRRLFPARARKKFLVMRITSIAGALCILIGIFLAR